MDTDRRLGRYARIGGVLYLFVIAGALFGELFVRGSLIVPGDAGATAAHIVASEALFRTGLAVEWVVCACDVTLALILYVLLGPVDHALALLAAFFRLSFVAIYGASKLAGMAVLTVLTNNAVLGALGTDALQALAYAALRLHDDGYSVSLLFFGLHCFVVGHLAARSGYLPRLVGRLLVMAGSGYACFSLARLVAPAFTSTWLYPWLLLPGFVAELSLALWLLRGRIDAAALSRARKGHARAIGVGMRD